MWGIAIAVLISGMAADESVAADPSVDANGKKLANCKGDCKNGRGWFTDERGFQYAGQWVDGQPHGEGAFGQDGAISYEGQWANGEKHGKGKFTYSDGAKYDGEWNDGHEHGHGRMTLTSGNTYVGGYKNGKQHGRGTHTNVATGKVTKAMWKNGEKKDSKYEKPTKSDIRDL